MHYFQFVLMTNIWLKFKFMSITDSKCKTMFHQYSYGFWIWFPVLSLGHLHNCWIVHISLTPMSAGQSIAIFPPFSLCTTGLKVLMRVTIDKQMKMQYITCNRVINSIYNVNELIIMIHISNAQQVRLKMFRVLIWYSLIVYSDLVYRK